MNAYTGTMEESQLLSSVYFDSADATSYQERIRREEGARLVRFRWYGEPLGPESRGVFVLFSTGFGWIRGLHRRRRKEQPGGRQGDLHRAEDPS